MKFKVKTFKLCVANFWRKKLKSRIQIRITESGSELLILIQQIISLSRLLDFSYNSLETIDSAAFGKLPTLLELDLSHNQLKRYLPHPPSF